MGKKGHCKQIPLSCVRSAYSGWTTLVLTQPKLVCTSKVHTAQASGCSAVALSQVCPAFCALPWSKLLRCFGTLQGHRPQWAVHFLPFPGPSNSGDQVLGKCTDSDGLCVLCTYPVPATWFPCCAQRAVSGVLCVSSGKLISGCDTPGRCEASRIPGRCG